MSAPWPSDGSDHIRPPMCFDDMAADRQTDAHAFRLGREERGEQARGDIRLQDLDLCRVKRIVAISASAVASMVISLRCLPVRLHRLDGVADEVDDDLLNLNPVRQHDFPRAPRRFDTEHDAGGEPGLGNARATASSISASADARALRRPRRGTRTASDDG